MYINGEHASKNPDAADNAFEDAGAPMISKYSPVVGLSTLPLNSQDIGTSSWQLGDKSTSAPSPDN
jgi:hypothetical protein